MAENLAVSAVAGPVASAVAAANGAVAYAAAAAAAAAAAVVVAAAAAAVVVAAAALHDAVHASLPAAIAQQHLAAGCKLVEQGSASCWAAG